MNMQVTKLDINLYSIEHYLANYILFEDTVLHCSFRSPAVHDYIEIKMLRILHKLCCSTTFSLKNLLSYSSVLEVFHNPVLYRQHLLLSWQNCYHICYSSHLSKRFPPDLRDLSGHPEVLLLNKSV